MANSVLSAFGQYRQFHVAAYLLSQLSTALEAAVTANERLDFLIGPIFYTKTVIYCYVTDAIRAMLIASRVALRARGVDHSALSLLPLCRRAAL